MSSASRFNKAYYFAQNPDVASAIEFGHFESELEHFEIFGLAELRAPNKFFSPTYYSSQNSDVQIAVEQGVFGGYFDHYQIFGELENRPPSIEFHGFDQGGYLDANEDVEKAVQNGTFGSALAHYIDFGQYEDRMGAFSNTATVFTLTSDFDIFRGTNGDDEFNADPTTLQFEDILDGRAGQDKLSITLDGSFINNLTLPAPSNISRLEMFSVSADIHQSIDFSDFSNVSNIELKDGATRADSTIAITLAPNQSLTLSNIQDGNSDNHVITHGGIFIHQKDSSNSLVIDSDTRNINSLNLKLDNFGQLASEASDLNKSTIMDFSNEQLTTIYLSTVGTNSGSLTNSGGGLVAMDVTGSGSLNIRDLPPSIRTVNATDSSGNYKFRITPENPNNVTINLGKGNNEIELANQNTVVVGDEGDETIQIVDGSHQIRTNAGDDYIKVVKGANSIFMGLGSDTAQIEDGVNTISTGSGSDGVTILDGTNSITLEGGDDSISISGGTNTLFTGDGNDQISITGGSTAISTGAGDDTITISGSSSNVDIRSLDGGVGADTLMVFSNGNVTLPTFNGFETFFITDTRHQSLNYSLSPNLTVIELDSGTTIDGATMTLTLGAGQSLILDGITDGDTAAASLADGGIAIVQDASITSLDLVLDDVGPATSINNENVFIDIAGTGISTAKVTSGNDSFVAISNSGGALTGLELLGAGSMALGTLPTSITNIDGTAATANLTLTIGSSGTNTIKGGTGNDAVTLTGGVNDVDTGDGDDVITTSTNLVSGDRIDGGSGTDTFEVIHTGLATIPSTANLSNIERIAIQDTVHQTLDFSSLTIITGVELDSGTTVDGATITTTLSANQSLTLDSITDGDSAAASLADGGIKIAQANSITSLDLTLDDIGPGSSNTNTNLFIDIAGTGVATANVTSTNTSFIVLENSGNALNTLNLTGSGTLGIQGTLANSITTINGLNSSANLTITSGTGDDTITGGSGNDTITLTGGTNNVTGGDGNDVIILSTGNDTVVSGNGNDDITAAGGTNNITTGANNDEVTLTGGDNTVNTGSGSDQITISGGDNDIDTGSSNDTVNVSNGNNDIETGSGSDQVTLTGGTNDIDTGNSNDTVTMGGVDTVDTGSGNDTVDAAATLTTADTVNGGSGTGDIIKSTAAITDALAARLSNFEVFDITGGGGITHDVSDLTGLTSLKANGSITGNIIITDLAAVAEVDISAALGNDLTINQINAVGGGSDTLTFDFSGSTYTTGGSIIAANIETVTLQTSAGGTKTLSGATFANAGILNITASSADLTISDLTAVNLQTLDVSSTSSRTTNITTGSDAFSNALTYTGGGGNDTLDLDGTTLQNTFAYNGGNGNDRLDLDNATLQNTFSYNGGSGANTLNLTNANVSGALTIDGGSGDDSIDLDGTTLQNTFAYNGENGNDRLELDNATLQNTFSYNGGSGDDELFLDGAALSGALTFEGGSGNDTVTLDGATLVAGTVFVVGEDQDTLTLNTDAVASIVRTSAVNSDNAFSIRDDATTANTAGFTPGSDTFDYNGSLRHDSNTSVVKAAGATLQAAVIADADATVYVIQDADGDADFETALNLFADGVSNSRANTMETEAIDTGLLSYSGLDTAFDASDIVLIAIDSETNEDGSLANNGGSAIYRFNNSNTSTADTILNSELELIGVFQDGALGVADFI